MGVFTLDIDRSKLRECQSLAYEAALRRIDSAFSALNQVIYVTD